MRTAPILLEPSKLTTPCPLCDPNTLPILWQCDQISVINAQEPDYPGFCRVIWRQHQTEMSQLNPAQRNQLMTIVFAVERVLIDQLKPDKINLASLGNQVAHLHWHVIPRFEQDRHFPEPVWATPQREPAPARKIIHGQLSAWLTPTLDAVWEEITAV